mgnify:CR=1 FL=1
MPKLPTCSAFGMAAMMGAATGPVGTARVQYDLRKVMLFLNAMPLVKPEVFIGMAAGKFDFGFAVDLMRKDLGICLAEARRQRR